MPDAAAARVLTDSVLGGFKDVETKFAVEAMPEWRKIAAMKIESEAKIGNRSCYINVDIASRKFGAKLAEMLTGELTHYGYKADNGFLRGTTFIKVEW